MTSAENSSSMPWAASRSITSAQWRSMCGTLASACAVGRRVTSAMRRRLLALGVEWREPVPADWQVLVVELGIVGNPPAPDDVHIPVGVTPCPAVAGIHTDEEAAAAVLE